MTTDTFLAKTSGFEASGTSTAKPQHLHRAITRALARNGVNTTDFMDAVRSAPPCARPAPRLCRRESCYPLLSAPGRAHLIATLEVV